MKRKSFKMGSFSPDEFDIVVLILNARAFRLLGIHWTKSVAWHVDFETGNLVFQYE